MATLDAPDEVCVGEEFEVDWSGPDVAGDLITIAYPDARPDNFIDSRRTSDGNPAVLRAPLVPGTYEIRYVRNEPPGVLARRAIEVSNCTRSVSEPGSGGLPGKRPPAGPAGIPQSCPISPYPADSYAFVIHGLQNESGMQLPPQDRFTLEQLCNVGAMVAPMLESLLNRVEIPLNVPIDMIRNNIANQLQSARNAICPVQESPGSEYWFTITYAHCRMAMDTIPYSMDIHLPPGLAEGTMSMADHAKQEIVQVTLKRDIDAAFERIGPGWGGNTNMTPTGRSGTHLGFSTTEYRFDQTGGLGQAGLGALTESDVYSGAITSPLALGNLVSVKTEGTFWATACVPGINIVEEFYENLSREVQPDQGSTSFMAGLINNTIALLAHGLPLETDTRISSRLAGVTKISGTSHAVITGFNVIPLPPQWCSQSLMPAGYAVKDIDQEIAQVTSGAPAGGTGSSTEAAQGMQQLNEAMQKLTPQQRQMLAKMGLAGAQQLSAANPAATEQAGAVAAAGTAAAGSPMPPAEDLYSDNLAQMVQRHLQALGYDPGNTDGDVSTKTVIAISQFQAEKGLEVTGEVSPQLAGVLSAEVDKRRP